MLHRVSILARLLILTKNFKLHNLIWSSTLINCKKSFEIQLYDKKNLGLFLLEENVRNVEVLPKEAAHLVLEFVAYTANAYRQTTDKLMFKSVKVLQSDESENRI